MFNRKFHQISPKTSKLFFIKKPFMFNRKKPMEKPNLNFRISIFFAPADTLGNFVAGFCKGKLAWLVGRETASIEANQFFGLHLESLGYPYGIGIDVNICCFMLYVYAHTHSKSREYGRLDTVILYIYVYIYIYQWDITISTAYFCSMM